MQILIMGVSGVGKSTIGQQLALELNYHFIEGDDLHSRVNIKKMASGIPLNDSDRAPWLKRISNKIKKSYIRNENLIITCSALKHSYREHFYNICPTLIVIWLYADYNVISRRLSSRLDHFMSPILLESQLADLEEPLDAIWVDANQETLVIVRQILEKLNSFMS